MYHEHSGRVFGYALRRTSCEEAKDLTSETFRVAWERLDVISEDPLPYLYGIARRLLANQKRGGRRRAALIEKLRSEASAEDPLSHEGTEEWLELERGSAGSPDRPADPSIRIAVSRLSAADQEVLALTYWEGLSSVATARVLGCTRAAVLVRLHRARRRLADELSRAEFEERASIANDSDEVPR
jgi:RNA polymerase sigma factor (sigma-70 family)